MSLRRNLSLVALFGLLASAEAFASPKPSFDDAWKEYQDAAAFRPPAGGTMTENIAAMTARNHRLTRLAWDLFEGYPEDPRRWQAAIAIIRTTNGYVYDVVGDPEKDGPKAFRRDTVARDAWAAYARALYEQLLAAPGLPEDTIKAGLDAWFYRLNMTPGAKSEVLRAAVDEYARRFPDDPKLASFEQRYHMRLEQQAPAAAAELVQRLLQSPNTAVRAMAEGKARLDTAKAAALEMKFTALDGREVDLAQLRGKVVLLDFWATWCGPCKAELPNIKAVYDRYHAQGFEVVAVSIDTEKDRQKLVDYCAENRLPWPQHFDGRGWKNEFAVKYSISAIPAMFLLDREGRIASSNARGEKLEAEVKRLLGL